MKSLRFHKADLGQSIYPNSKTQIFDTKFSHSTNDELYGSFHSRINIEFSTVLSLVQSQEENNKEIFNHKDLTYIYGINNLDRNHYSYKLFYSNQQKFENKPLDYGGTPSNTFFPSPSQSRYPSIITYSKTYRKDTLIYISVASGVFGVLLVVLAGYIVYSKCISNKNPKIYAAHMSPTENSFNIKRRYYNAERMEKEKSMHSKGHYTTRA